MKDAENTSSVAAGGIYRDILEWSAVLPLWQQELLRRILSKPEISSSDIVELAAAAVAHAEQQATTFAPLSSQDLPSVAMAGDPRSLVAVRDLFNVNALRPDQALKFGAQLTVVYGDNASGKSGYARVMKKVYRARVVEDILGDVRSEKPSADPPRATFIVKDPGGSEHAISWEEGKAVLDAGRFAVLDASCSHTYVRGGALALGPPGIDVPRRFAESLDMVKQHLASQAAAALPDKRTLQRLENDTPAGQFVRALSSSTSEADVTAMATWSSEDEAELHRLTLSILEARAKTASVRRQELQARLKALESLGKRLAQWSLAVGADHVAAFTAASAEVRDAESAVRASEALSDSSVSPHLVGGRIWLDLLRAAAAYVGSVSPAPTTGASPLSIDDRCSLCWQLLDEAATTRLARFQQFMEGRAAKGRQAALEKRESLLRSVRDIPDNTTPEDDAVLATVEGLPDRVRNLMTSLRSARDVILESARTGAAIPTLSPPDPSPVQALRGLYASLQQEMKQLPANDAESEAHISALERRKLELTTRRALSQSATEVIEFVRRIRQHLRLKGAETTINTKATSSKASELHAKHMTERYAQLVDDELRGLRFRRRRPVFSQKTSKARVEVAPIVSPEMKHIAAERVFSEGERTAIAIACFLAELQLGDDPSGLIFDDPVSSLDHNIREHVARRIVHAAKDRQVIVFTHDLAFLADLREQAKKIQGVACEFRSLTATDYAAGFVEEEEPFGARNVKKRVGVLKNLVTDAERAAKQGDLGTLRVKAKEFYEALRATWERYIEERLFANVVQRLERNVTPGALAKVAYTKELGERVHEGWRRCSNVLEAHDHAPAAGGQSYAVQDMKGDLNALLEAEKLASAG